MSKPSYAPLGFEPYDHWYQRIESLGYDANKSGVAWGLYGAPSQPRQYLPLAFNRSDWNDNIIAHMTNLPPVTPAESGVEKPNSASNKRRRKNLTRKVVERRVLAGYLLEEAEELEETLNELGGPQGSLADVIHNTKGLSTREVDKRTRRALSNEFKPARSERSFALEPLLDFFLALVTDPMGLAVATFISVFVITALLTMFVTH